MATATAPAPVKALSTTYTVRGATSGKIVRTRCENLACARAFAAGWVRHADEEAEIVEEAADVELLGVVQTITRDEAIEADRRDREADARPAPPVDAATAPQAARAARLGELSGLDVRYNPRAFFGGDDASMGHLFEAMYADTEDAAGFDLDDRRSDPLALQVVHGLRARAQALLDQAERARLAFVAAGLLPRIDDDLDMTLDHLGE